MTDIEFMSYLQHNYPYLYDIEVEVQKTIDRTGFGDVSFVLRVLNGFVDKSELLGTATKIYKKRDKNVF